MYVDDGTIPGPPANFYDCKYDFVATDGGPGWHTLAVTGATPASNVTTRGGAACGDRPEAASPGSAIFLVALDAGDTASSDTGCRAASTTSG